MTDRRRHASTSQRLLLSCGLVAPSVDVLVTIGLAAADPEYSHAWQFISELGEVGRPHAAVFNAWSVVYGLHFAGFAVALGRALGSRPALFAALTIAVCSIADGLFPCDPGCAGRTPVARVHMLSGYVSLPAIVLTPYFAWLALRGNDSWSKLRVLSLACSGLLLGGAVWLAICNFQSGPVGLAQRFVLGVLYAWMAAVVIGLWREPYLAVESDD